MPASAAVLGADSSTSQQATPAPINEQLNSFDSTSSVPVSGAPVITPQNATSSMPPLAGNGSLYLTNPIKNGHAPELEASPAPASNKSEKGKLSKWTMKYVKDRLLKPKDKPSHTGKGHVLTSDGSPPPYSSIP
ncbi:hypothetical protein EST38_g7426 [Candolleomyces aberdarensis]|uniref:Uncharacterized protein n=1 Tax=Candolleomyces aberdarensis TaxID=2316362 RepID=A0A4Q2DIG4_9AGAR|nr:hypothetical protein EST38_g7426 [Candolleomyces aberdarensis]